MTWSRFILAGLAAGLVNTLFGLALARFAMPEMLESLRAHNLRAINKPADAAAHVLQRLLMGFVTAALYVAVGPRFDPGLSSVLVATVFVWLLAYARPFWNHVHIGLFPAALMLKIGAFGLVETLLTAGAAALVLE